MMIKAGKFPARVTALQWGKSSVGNTQCVITFQILAGPDRGMDITAFLSFTDKTLERTFESLAICGWPRGVLLSDLTAEHLTSLVDIVINHEEYQGKTNAKVSWINRPGSGGMKLKNPLTPEDLRKFAASMAHHMGKVTHLDPIPVPDDLANVYADTPANGAGDGNQGGGGYQGGGDDHPHAPGNNDGQQQFGRPDDDIPF